MGKLLQSEYQLDYEPLTPEQLKKALSGDLEGFRYWFENCFQLQDKNTREIIHPKLNKGQEMIAETILAHVAKETRADTHKEVVICGPRQFGKSTLMTALANYIVAYVSGMERLNVVHTLQTGATASKYYNQKIKPIVAGVHPDIFPNIERDTMGTSTLLKYTDIQGIPRGGYYEITSAGSNSVRSGTVSVWLCDEPAEYRNPEMVEDAISGAIGDYGFSFTAYIGTFSDRLSDYFLSKIQAALDPANDMELVFIPWYLVYGREEDAKGITEDMFTEYDRDVLIPELTKAGLSYEERLCKIGWYHRRAVRTAHMKYEFPTSIDDIMSLAASHQYFDAEVINKQEENLKNGACYRILTDNASRKIEARETDASPFKIFTKPYYGHKYRIVIDPITAMGEATDNFIMHVMDLRNNEQVATFAEKGLSDQDYADWAIGIGQIYNNAQLCPESNVSNGFVTAVNDRRYYHWYYDGKKNHSDRIPGLRTTVATKETYLDRLTTMLTRGTIIIRDAATLDELRTIVKIKKVRQDGSTSYKVAAKKGKHDDRVSALWIYAGSVEDSQIAGKKNSGGMVCW